VPATSAGAVFANTAGSRAEALPDTMQDRDHGPAFSPRMLAIPSTAAADAAACRRNG